jgi:hypothetical protein
MVCHRSTSRAVRWRASPLLRQRRSHFNVNILCCFMHWFLVVSNTVLGHEGCFRGRWVLGAAGRPARR